MNRSLGFLVIGTLALLPVTLASAEPRLEIIQNKQPVMFKSPDGYFPGDFSKHAGKLFLNPKNPAGMFVGYPADGQDIAARSLMKLRDWLSKCFFTTRRT